jgi:hypothetical protein
VSIPAEHGKADLPPVAVVTGPPVRSETRRLGAEERSAMRNVALDMGAKTISYCEVHEGQVVDRATVRRLDDLEVRLGPKAGPARVASGLSSPRHSCR